jgi:hypothetical protein
MNVPLWLRSKLRHYNEGELVSLWDLLIAVCFVMPLAGGLAEAKLSKAGFGGYALVVAAGLALGLCFAWTMWTAGKFVAARIR